MHYVTHYQDNGPYFSPTRDRWEIHCFRDLLFHVRRCMEDHDDYVAVYQGDRCAAIWSRESDIQSDGEGGMESAGEWYEMHRPGSLSPGLWNIMEKRCRVG